MGPENARIRREAGPNVVLAAQRSGARGLVVESISFVAAGEGGSAILELEAGALASGLPTWVLRFSRLWGPETFSETPQNDDAVEVGRAGRLAAEVLPQPPGVYVVDALGWRPVRPPDRTGRPA